MKTMRSLFLILMLVGSTTGWADNRKHHATAASLPEISRAFLNTHFGEMKISYVEVDKYLLWVKEYEVILIDGTEVNFDRHGEWTEVDCRKTAVPAVIIPAEIVSYLNSYYPQKTVVAIEKESRKWEIKLDNGMELSFNKQGDLIDMDAD